MPLFIKQAGKINAVALGLDNDTVAILLKTFSGELPKRGKDYSDYLKMV